MTTNAISDHELKVAIEELIEGDNNGICFLDSQYADWVEVKLSNKYDIEKIDDEFGHVTIEGEIVSMSYWKEGDKYISAWGDNYEFDLEKVEHDDKNLYNIKGEWTFEYKRNEFGYIELNEIESVQI